MVVKISYVNWLGTVYKVVKLVMSSCVLEEGRDEGGGTVAGAASVYAEPGISGMSGGELIERPRREVLLSGRGRRACSEQGPHPGLLVRGKFRTKLKPFFDKNNPQVCV